MRPITGWDGIDVWRTGKNIVHVTGYSAVTDGRLVVSNKYGTSLSTTTYDPDGTLVVTQSEYDTSLAASHYRNGYFVIADDNLVFGKTYNVSFKITNITNNPFGVTLNNIRISGPSGASYAPPYLVNGDTLYYRI